MISGLLVKPMMSFVGSSNTYEPSFSLKQVQPNKRPNSCSAAASYPMCAGTWNKDWKVSESDTDKELWDLLWPQAPWVNLILSLKSKSNLDPLNVFTAQKLQRVIVVSWLSHFFLLFFLTFLNQPHLFSWFEFRDRVFSHFYPELWALTPDQSFSIHL